MEMNDSDGGEQKRAAVSPTCGRVDRPLDQVVVLMDPLAVALEVDLRGRGGAAGQHHRLVLHDVLVLGLHQEVR